MNGLTLRITGGGSKKIKTSCRFAPVVLPDSTSEDLDSSNEFINLFLKSITADEQLIVLKKNLNMNKEDTNLNITTFLVVLYWQAEVKHPVKCFITRYITKNAHLQTQFSELLSQHITKQIVTNKQIMYREYTDAVTRMSSCIENFPAGVAAVKSIETLLAEYLSDCLKECVQTLRVKTSLSPTEKNEIFNLAHLSLRLLHYIVQKVDPTNLPKLISIFDAIRLNIKNLLFDVDAPMDTKSLCGILFLSMHILENNPGSWTEILESSSQKQLEELMSNESAKFSLYSAIATVVGTEELHSTLVKGEPAVLTLTRDVLAIGEETSAESVFTLGVTRTLVQISKGLSQAQKDLGVQLVDALLVFVWPHLDHYMDSVRHLAAHALNSVVRFCVKLQREGEAGALDGVFSALGALDRLRKSFYVGLAALAAELGAAAALARLPRLLPDTVAALDVQAVQASATTSLEVLLQKHAKESNGEVIYEMWVVPILHHISENELDSSVLNVLEKLLAAAVKLDPQVMDYIVPYIKETGNETPAQLKCILILLSVARKAACIHALGSNPDPHMWKGVIGYDVLMAAAVDAVDETRILSLSLIVESPKSTEVFQPQELRLVLWYLKYNINAQAPNYRQLTLSLMKKFIKRIENGYRVLRKQIESCDSEDRVDYYLPFVEELRAQCFDSLVAGANCGRRAGALQLLLGTHDLHLDGYCGVWKKDYVEKLLLHLEDSYENNKALALAILCKCPVQLLKDHKYTTSLELMDIFRQASSVKPTECVSAAYKLKLLLNMLPEYIMEGALCEEPEGVAYTLLRKLLNELSPEVAVCRHSVVRAARGAPMYGLLHCMSRVMDAVDPEAIKDSEAWSELVSELIEVCVAVKAAVSGVVTSAAPEGLLPDAGHTGGAGLTHQAHRTLADNGPNLPDGPPVTAQMVLLCAWRSIKEVSLLLASIASRLTVRAGGAGGSLSVRQVRDIGEHFTELLANTKHRGAFEQAYVDFTKLLTRLWRSRQEALHSLPRGWARRLLAALEAEGGGPGAAPAATRRSAGLPFLMQALVTTELQVQGNQCLTDCISRLLRLQGRQGGQGATHATNILRALFRDSALEDSLSGYVAEALVRAFRGFAGDTWEERNSSTLLFSTLMVRIFGVQRTKDTDTLPIRNRMTGRIFFLRYPQLYDFMLNELKEASGGVGDVGSVDGVGGVGGVGGVCGVGGVSGVCGVGEGRLRPSLYPLLLLLARLYPSSLEGTVSNLKLAAFVPLVGHCSRSAVLHTRRLAARALSPLLPPARCIFHIISMLELLNNENIERNYCHGIILQLIRIISDREQIELQAEEKASVSREVLGTAWILRQEGGNFCYLLADEYTKLINLMLWRFPSLLQLDFLKQLQDDLLKLIFKKQTCAVTPGRDVCLANATSLYLVTTQYCQTNPLIFECIEHDTYEVVLSVLNYLLILHKELAIEDKFQEHLAFITKNTEKSDLATLQRHPKYIACLCEVLKTNKYLECIQKSLRLLTLAGNTQKEIIKAKTGDEEVTDEIVVEKLCYYIDNEHENETHIYLKSLVNFISSKLNELTFRMILEAIRVIYSCSSPDNSENARAVVVEFLERDLKTLLAQTECTFRQRQHDDGLTREEVFVHRATLLATTATLLQDDDNTLRQRTANVVTTLPIHPGTDPGAGPERVVVPQRAADLLRGYVRGHSDADVLLILLALLDFRSEVCLTDEVNDEGRVFDRNEKYNIYLEETIWSCECADAFKQLYVNGQISLDIVEYVEGIISHPQYKETFEKLCNNNYALFKKIVNNEPISESIVNPKIQLFIDRLRNDPFLE